MVRPPAEKHPWTQLCNVFLDRIRAGERNGRRAATAALSSSISVRLALWHLCSTAVFSACGSDAGPARFPPRLVFSSSSLLLLLLAHCWINASAWKNRQAHNTLTLTSHMDSDEMHVLSGCIVSILVECNAIVCGRTDMVGNQWGPVNGVRIVPARPEETGLFLCLLFWGVYVIFFFGTVNTGGYRVITDWTIVWFVLFFLHCSLGCFVFDCFFWSGFDCLVVHGLWRESQCVCGPANSCCQQFDCTLVTYLGSLLKWWLLPWGLWGKYRMTSSFLHISDLFCYFFVIAFSYFCCHCVIWTWDGNNVCSGI